MNKVEVEVEVEIEVEVEHSSCEWTEYDDFPSSENLSAFLTDLATGYYK